MGHVRCYKSGNEVFRSVYPKVFCIYRSRYAPISRSTLSVIQHVHSKKHHRNQESVQRRSYRDIVFYYSVRFKAAIFQHDSSYFFYLQVAPHEQFSTSIAIHSIISICHPIFKLFQQYPNNQDFSSVHSKTSFSRLNHWRRGVCLRIWVEGGDYVRARKSFR